MISMLSSRHSAEILIHGSQVEVLGVDRLRNSVGAHIDSACYVASNWITLRGWILGVNRGRLEIRSHVKRAIITLEERPDVYSILSASPDWSFGFVAHLIDDQALSLFPLEPEIWVGGKPALRILLDLGVSSLPLLPVARQPALDIAHSICDPGLLECSEQLLPPAFQGRVPTPIYYGRSSLDFISHPQTVGLHVNGGAVSRTFDNLVVIDEYFWPATAAVWDGKRIPFHSEAFDFVLLSQRPDCPITRELCLEADRVLRPQGFLLFESGSSPVADVLTELGYAATERPSAYRKALNDSAKATSIWTAAHAQPQLPVLTPPQDFINAIGDGDFTAIGRGFLDHFVQVGLLKPEHRFLDVGCGAGRMALQLTRYLNDLGSYEGFDVNPVVIDWCVANIAPRCPSFRFMLIPLFNSLYNASALERAANFKFPYPDRDFDFVSATSVFTHLLPPDAARYIEEISRVLKPGGRAFLTFFLLDDFARESIAAKKPRFLFSTQLDAFTHIENPEIPEYAVAYDQDWIRRLHQKNGLRIVEPIHYGGWARRPDHLTLQDVIVAEKI
jgi:SAM-dependent methyltransferase